MVAAAAGSFPPADGDVTVVPPDATTGLSAVLGFTAHTVVATELTESEVRVLGIDGYDGAFAPDALRALAGPSGWIGVLDAVLVAAGTGRSGTTLVRSAAHADDRRVQYAQQVRSDVVVLADDRGLVTLGTGIGGRRELGVEIPGEDHRRGLGLGRAILRDALHEVPAGEAVFASCAPGNARSMRALLAAGFRIIGSEVLIRPDVGRSDHS